MEVIIGGAFQGKCAYAMEKYGLCAGDIQTMKDISFDLTKKAYNNCHELVFCLLKRDIDVVPFFEQNIEKLNDKVLIFDDISSGVVPVDPFIRKGREENGRALNYLCGKANVVTRVFCGLPTILKNEKIH